MSRRNSLVRALTQEAGLLPLPGQGGNTSPVNIPWRGSNINHVKCRKGVERRDIDHSSRTVSDVPVYKILQRPKHGDMAVDVLAQFVVLDDVKARSAMVVEKNVLSKKSQNDGVDGVDKCNNHGKAALGISDVNSDGVKYRSKGSDTKPARGGSKGGSVYEPKDMSRFLNGVRTSFVEGYELSSVKAGAAKPKNAPNDSARGPPPRMVSKSFVTKVSGKGTDVSCKAVIVQGSEESCSLPRLRRTSTEPQIISTHTLGQYKNKVIHASFQKSKSESHAHDRGLFVNTTSLSCQERWAGPAYTSSPSPSSLPLPKLCLPQTRFSSLEIPPLAKQYSSSVYMQPFLGSSVPAEKGGAWDVAFATKSLRKMLNLDPC